LRYRSVLLSGGALAASIALFFTWPVSADVKPVRLLCEAVYLPARAVWSRAVEFEHDDQVLTVVRIDGVPVHTFAVEGTLVMTALDNERIQIDVARQTWHSDFRGLAQSQGRCERTR